MQISLKQKLQYARFIQIACVFIFGLGMYLFTTIPHNWWIFLTVIIMCGATEPGLMVQRSILRGKGTLIAIGLFIPLIYLLQFNYRAIPLTFILLGVGVGIPTAKRYDISVIFITMTVFMVTPYMFTEPLAEGPIEMSLNRLICTIIGILICLVGDYFLFARFEYSRKAYLVLQRELCSLLEHKLDIIKNARNHQLNTYLVIESLRDSFNLTFTQVTTSGEGLLYDLTSDEETKTKIKAFDTLIWQLRKVVFALCYAECVLKDPVASLEHQERFQYLLAKAKQNLISLHPNKK